MTLVLIIKDLVFEGPTPKTKDKWVPGTQSATLSFNLVCVVSNLTGEEPWNETSQRPQEIRES